MPAETNANIHPSFAPPAPIEKVVGPDFAEPVPAVPKDWTTGGVQSADQVASGAKGERHVTAPSVQQMRKEAAGG